MSDFFARDPSIQDNDALRTLEKKIHYLMASLDYNGMLIDPSIQNVPSMPNDIMADAMEVARQL